MGATRLSDRGACSGAQAAAEWERIVTPYLEDTLWTENFAYDAGHFLQVPLHAAFALGRRDWQQAFGDHFQSFIDAGPPRIDNPLYRFQYLYLASRFLVLAQSHRRIDLIPEGLPAELFREVQRAWEIEPARHWSHDPERQGLVMRDLLDWKLRVRDVEPGYLRAFRDEELFLLVVAADLEKFRRSSQEPTGLDENVLADVLETSDRLFSQELSRLDDGPGWLLQAGVWSSHPDYRYAGHGRLEPNLDPAPIEGLSMDSAHRHRLPLWLISLAGAHDAGTSGRTHYLGLWRQLETHFMETILVSPGQGFPGYRLVNFMDGRNGVYRYGYQTLGAAQGYGPYGRSGKLRLGWWRFLPGRPPYRLYRDLCAEHPLPEPVATLYTGPATSRTRHPIITEVEDRFRELLVYLAAEIPSSFIDRLPAS